MRLVFVMDTLDRVDPKKDTTFGFIESATLLGHRCDHCLIQEVALLGGTVSAPVRKIVYSPDGLTLDGEPERLSFDDAGDFSDGFAVVRNGKFSWEAAGPKPEFNYLSKGGTLLSPVWFDRALPFFDGLAAVNVAGRWSWIDSQGRVLVESRPNSPGLPRDEGSANQ